MTWSIALPQLEKVTVYGLKASDVDAVRYIGQTKTSLGLRLKHHLIAAKRFPNRHVSKWISSVLARGCSVIACVLENDAIADQAEMQWIAAIKDFGIKLTNGTVGGEGVRGNSLSVEARKKISASLTGRKQSAQTKAKRVAAIIGRKNTFATLRKMSEAHMGKKCPWRAEMNRDPEFIHKSAKSRIEKWSVTPKKGPSTSARIAISAKLKGLIRSPETREKMAAAKRAWWAERRSANVDS